jgi:hypothetical protein
MTNLRPDAHLLNEKERKEKNHFIVADEACKE